MRLMKYFLCSIVLALLFVFLFDRQSFCWSLFNLFKTNQYTEQGLDEAVNFDFENQLIFLPGLEGKNFFAAIDDLSLCRKTEVRKYMYIYLTKGRGFVINAIENSARHLDTVEQIFKENPDLPPDLMYLPLLESGFNPRAVSRTKATGLWQFVRSTSRVLGLRNDRWIDERIDVEKSTRAAVRHLRSLYSIWGSWELALASYNGGAGHVSKSLKKAGTKDFWQLLKQQAFREETNQFVPRFAALLLIYKNQELFGIKDEIEKQETLPQEKLTIQYPVKMTHLAKVTGIPLHTLRALNPQLKRNLTPPYYKKYKITVPPGTKEKITKKIYKVRFSRLKKHRVKRGECISKIARNYHTSPRKIIYINDLHKPYVVRPGKELYIPLS